MIDMRPKSYITQMTIPELVDFLENEPDGLYRVILDNGKIYQVIKSKGEVTTVVNPQGYIFRRNKKLAGGFASPGWFDVDQLEDINSFLFVAQVKGWI